jgi:hypothetical protein
MYRLWDSQLTQQYTLQVIQQTIGISGGNKENLDLHVVVTTVKLALVSFIKCSASFVFGSALHIEDY